MKLQSAGLTDIGCRRNKNQDRFILNEKAKLFVVADGMGGHVAGEVAAQIATDTINQIFSVQMGSIDPAIHLIKAIEQANLNIYEHAMQNPSLKGMGTTMTALYFSYDTIYIAHVGDSRVYLVKEGMIWQLSQDHSLVSEQMVGGMAFPLRNVITRSVGYDREIEVDLYTKKIAPGDYYLLCTDGLYNFVRNKEIANILSTSSVESAAKRCIELANSRGGDDNITVLAVKVDQV